MITELFKYTDADHSLTEAAEVEAIEAAQAFDGEAYERLLLAYGPTLRASVNRAKKTLDADEAQATALLTFAEILASHDPHNPDYANGRLAARLKPALVDALNIAQSEAQSFTVPKRSYVRYIGILNAADGDVVAARALAPSMSMSVETFDAIRQAVTADSLTAPADDDGGNEDHARPIYSESPISDAEDAVLVDVAFRAVDDDEERICRLSYGFTEYDPQPDAEIAHRMDLTRPTVQRKRAKALAKMRKVLGVTHA